MCTNQGSVVPLIQFFSSERILQAMNDQAKIAEQDRFENEKLVHNATTNWSVINFDQSSPVKNRSPIGGLGAAESLIDLASCPLPHADSLPQSVVADGNRIYVSDVMNNQIHLFEDEIYKGGWPKNVNFKTPRYLCLMEEPEGKTNCKSRQ